MLAMEREDKELLWPKRWVVYVVVWVVDGVGWPSSKKQSITTETPPITPQNPINNFALIN